MSVPHALLRRAALHRRDHVSARTLLVPLTTAPQGRNARHLQVGPRTPLRRGRRAQTSCSLSQPDLSHQRCEAQRCQQIVRKLVGSRALVYPGLKSRLLRQQTLPAHHSRAAEIGFANFAALPKADLGCKWCPSCETGRSDRLATHLRRSQRSCINEVSYRILAQRRISTTLLSTLQDSFASNAPMHRGAPLLALY